MGDTVELLRIRPPPIDTTARDFTTEDPTNGSTSPRRDIYDEFFPPAAHNIDDDVIHTIRPAWKRNLHFLLERPTTSQAAFVVHVFTTFMIVLSAVITVLETVPTFHSIPTRIWFGMETTLVAIFTIEYVARCVAWSFSWSSLFHWVISFFGIIDLLSVLPYYILLMIRQDTSAFFRFSILRMFRLLRVFRPFRYNHTILMTIEVMYLSVHRSQHALLAIGFFVIMILTVFSTLLYFAERGTWDETLGTFINSDGDPTLFSSIPAAAWFVVVTITTVGYGEITPRSFLGRLLTLPILVFGLLLITLPSFVLGREFSLVWHSMLAKKRQDQNMPPMPPSMAPDYDMHGPGPGTPFLHSAYPPPQQPPHSATTALRPRDLSNLKLAQNQTELSRQIGELREVVEGQGRLVERLVGLLEKRGGGGEVY
ncbi:voltage-gated potassium channel [Coprinopsis marcescibilis]|uniref:Voltage-gated potassium channel n=1 Tax=Coprinopsis marcescibilis TaxID=230819 RepID=A0A5C3KF77_COPMA|nr:voltage-gated potassium channel [Coprinopsis marcescibilis]